MKNTIKILILLLLTSCEKQDTNVMSLESVCFDGEYYQVNYFVGVYDTSAETWITFTGVNKAENKIKVSGGLGSHSIKIKVPARVCAGVILIQNGENRFYIKGDCKKCGI